MFCKFALYFRNMIRAPLGTTFKETSTCLFWENKSIFEINISFLKIIAKDKKKIKNKINKINLTKNKN